MIADLADAQISEDGVSSLLATAAAEINSKPFVPHRLITKGDAQTIGAYLWPARLRLRDQTGDEMRLFDVAPDTKVLARCRWQPDRLTQPTLVMWHGMEGSIASAYMLTTAAKAFGAGFNVVRVNMRNCGGTEHLTPTLYHGGMAEDLRAVLNELIDKDRLPRIVLAGFSLGGNKVLKLAGEYGEQAPRALKGVCAISPSINLRAGCDLLMQPRNWLYHQDFLYYLKRRIKTKQRLFPNLYDTTGLRSIRTIEQYDTRYITPAFGFADVNDYYAKASALPVMGRIRIPSLIIHAQDDPFVPFGPLRGLLPPLPAGGEGTEGWGCDVPNLSPNPSPHAERGQTCSVTSNPNVLLIAPPRGGHVAFLSGDSRDEDRFWAENRLVDFSELAAAN